MASQPCTLVPSQGAARRARLRRWRWWLLMLVLAALGAGGALYTDGSVPDGAIYSVRQVQDSVRRQPDRWAGRAVWVYGELVALCKLPDGEGPADALCNFSGPAGPPMPRYGLLDSSEAIPGGEPGLPGWVLTGMLPVEFGPMGWRDALDILEPYFWTHHPFESALHRVHLRAERPCAYNGLARCVVAEM